jgi:hypothetical protein
MNDQRQHSIRQEGLLPGAADSDAADSAERLASAREQIDRIHAAADSILDEIRLSNSERFLEQARQSGGE